ncbi:MAG: HEAT repeat domain-containing protein [Acidimicrobiales bacterium]
MTANPADRRQQAAAAGYSSKGRSARSFVDDTDNSVRATALGALHRLGELTNDDLEKALEDPSPNVRRRALTISTQFQDVAIDQLLDDKDIAIAEVAAWACGERPVEDHIVAALARMAEGHDDPLCREAAVAALGALGDEAGRQAILAGLDDIVAVRRRATLALAPFDGDDITAALQQALDDRDWQVRQAAEDLLPPDSE